MKKLLRFVLGISIFLLWALWAYLYYFPTTQNVATIANPAALFCLQNSGTSEIVTDASWWQLWICHLSNGTTCDERAYFRWECPATGTVEITGTIETSWWLMDQVSQEIANQQPSNVVTTLPSQTSTDINNIDVFFQNHTAPIDIMFKNALIANKLQSIIIPNHDSVKSNPAWVIDIDWGYRFTILDKSEIATILQTFNRSDLPDYDSENWASIYIEFKKIDNTHVQLWIAHYVGMAKTDLVKKIYKTTDML